MMFERNMAKVKVCADYLRDHPSVIIEILKDAVVWNAVHDFVSNTIEYTLEHSRFPKHRIGCQMAYVFPIITIVDDRGYKYPSVSWGAQ